MSPEAMKAVVDVVRKAHLYVSCKSKANPTRTGVAVMPRIIGKLAIPRMEPKYREPK
jgi:hypothetical protein